MLPLCTVVHKDPDFHMHPDIFHMLETEAYKKPNQTKNKQQTPQNI